MSFITIFAQAHPLLSLIIFTFIITFASTLAFKFLTDQKKVKELNEQQKKFREEMKQNKDNPQKMMEIQKQMLEGSMESMKMSFKPMLITFIPFLILLGFLNSLYKSINAGKIMTPIIGNANWVVVYIIFGVIFSLILKKVQKA